MLKYLTSLIMLQPPAFDNRFSMADSEWSRDDSELGSPHPAEIPNYARVNSQPLYDVPADVQGRVLLPEAEEEIYLQAIPRNKTSSSAKKKASPSFSNFPPKQRQIPLKICVALLTVLVFASIGLLLYIVMKWNLLFEQNVMFVVHRTYDQNMSEQEAKLEDLKIVLNGVTSELNKDCRSNVEIFSTCFSIHSTSSVVQAMAVLECKRHGINATLAMLDKPDILRTLSRHISDERSFWVDGSRIESGGVHNCVSFVNHNGSATLTNINCNDDLTGYICQYPISNPT